MLIIFDLDDTLIDTSGSITPSRIHEIITYFVQKGLVTSFDRGYQEFCQLNEKVITLSDALTIYVEALGGSSSLIEAAKEIYNNPHLSMDIKTLPHAAEVLDRLQKKYKLALLSYGKEQMQLSKLEKSGLSQSFFQKIVICNERNKKPYYKEILDSLDVSPNETIVCGDRVVYDLLPAKQLGCHTIHMRWGRGKVPQDSEEFVDRQVNNLEECYQVVESGF